MNTESQLWREDEIDLRELFLVLWNGKWIIMSIVFVSALAVSVGFSLFYTPSYEAIATLLIMPPPYQTSIEPETLALDIYKNLASTSSIANEVINELDLKNSNGEALSAQELLKKVTVDVSVPQGGKQDRPEDRGILTIKARADEPGLAKNIANTWAEAFLDSTSGLRKTESDGVAQVIFKQFDSTKDALKEAEQGLLLFRSTNSIPLAKQEISLLQAQLGERREHILSTQTKLEVKRHQLTTSEAQVAALEYDGLWRGALTRDPASLPGGSHPAAERTQAIAKEVLRSEEALARFENEANISTLSRDLQAEKERLANYKDNLLDLRISLPRLETRVESLAASLEGEPDKLVMFRSLSTDVLWRTLSIDGESVPLQDLSQLRLEDEYRNENYHYLYKSLLDAQLELSSLPGRIRAYEDLIVQSALRVSELEAQLRELQRQQNAFRGEAELSKELYNGLKKQYTSLQETVSNLQLEVFKLEAELELALPELAKYEEAVFRAERDLLNLQLEEEWLTRNVDSLKSTYNALAARAETARLAELHAVGNVRMVSPAVVPRSPLPSNRLLNLAIAVVLGGMVGVGIVFIKNLFHGEYGMAV